LHDTTIADLITLRRYVAGERQLTMEEIVKTLDDVVAQLRDICNDYAPRQLHDWGLKVAIQNLADRLKLRSKVDVRVTCTAELSNLPEPVELHSFRIAQEWLNNIEKHANASQVLIFISSTDEFIRFEITDDGKGLKAPEASKDVNAALSPLASGGVGMHSIQERVELIRPFCPAQVKIESVLGKGSQLILELTRSKAQESKE
jgi:signal transduction histidine kinase